MKKSQASEDSFARANNFYILMWVVTTVVVVSAYIDFRSFSRDHDANTHLIKFYSEFERDARDVAMHIRSAVYLMPGYKSEKDGIDRIRRLRSAIIAQLKWLDENFTIKTPDLETDRRIEIRKALNFIEAMLLLNDAISLEAGPPRIDDEPSLLLAQHTAGSYLVASKIENLRIEDAARYLWLSTLDLPSWSDALKKHTAALHNDTVLPNFGSDLTEAMKSASRADNKTKRKKAHRIWTRWFVESNNKKVDEEERRRRASLTLAQTSQFLGQAHQKQTQLKLRAGGEASTVEIPVISIPLQLKDAALVTPWIIAFCALAMAIYTGRAIRYAPENPNDESIIGNLPSFYAFYGFNKFFGVLFAILLLLIPPLTLAFLLPLFIPAIADGLDAESIFYFTGVLLAIGFLVLPLAQIPSVLKLVDTGIVIKAIPKAGFPHVGWQDHASVHRSKAAMDSDVVPDQFQGCWKHVTSAATTHYLRMFPDGRYFLSIGLQTFSISPDGLEFNWADEVWTRVLGSGQTVVGHWSLDIDEFVVRSDGTTIFHASPHDMAGQIETFGDNSGGRLIYWELRAQIVSCVDDCNGNFRVTANSLFGGSQTFQLSIQNDQMVLINEAGETYMYDDVECQDL